MKKGKSKGGLVDICNQPWERCSGQGEDLKLTLEAASPFAYPSLETSGEGGCTATLVRALFHFLSEHSALPGALVRKRVGQGAQCPPKSGSETGFRKQSTEAMEDAQGTRIGAFGQVPLSLS